MAGDKKKQIIDKSLCKLVKDSLLSDDLPSYLKLVSDGKYLCRKCGRVAKRKKNICKAEPL